MAVDLHIHTTVSDGADTPEEIVQKALAIGLEAIAISDHDSMSGVCPARAAARGTGLEVLPGVEMNSYYESKEIHLLGYLIDPLNEQFAVKLQQLQLDRLQRAAKIIDKLAALDLRIDLERVLEIAGGGSVGRPHIAEAMVEAGIVPNREAAFQKYIGSLGPAYVPRTRITPVEAVSLIKAAGGVPVLAHPGVSGCSEIIPELQAAGLMGLEVYHTNHKPLMVDYYLKIARDYHLIVTGGSDYHGAGHGSCNQLGRATVSYQAVEQLKSRAGNRKFLN